MQEAARTERVQEQPLAICRLCVWGGGREESSLWHQQRANSHWPLLPVCGGWVGGGEGGKSHHHGIKRGSTGNR